MSWRDSTETASIHNTSKLAQTTAAAWLAAALISVFIGLLQYFGVAPLFAPWLNSATLGEAYGNLRQRNQFASLTNIGLLAALWWVARGRLASPASLVAAFWLGIGNAASSSRTGLLQLVLIVALVAWWSRLRWAGARPGHRRVMLAVVAAALAGYAAGAVLLPLLLGLGWGGGGILGRLHETAQGCSSRWALWGNVLHLIAQKPWLGWGWGELDFAHFITLYPGPTEARFCDILDNAHNLPLHLAVELGVPLALLACGTALWLVWRAKPWREVDGTRQLAWGVLAVIGVHSLLEYPLWYGPFQTAVGLCVALLWRTPAVGSTLPSALILEGKRAIAPVLYHFIATIIIVLTAYAAWDYYRISQIYLAPQSRAEAYRVNTLAKIKDSWLFQNQVQFAELTTTPLVPENAAHLNALAHDLLHFSPEARVAQKLIDSASLLGKTDEAAFFEARFKAAFPQDYARWSAQRK